MSENFNKQESRSHLFTSSSLALRFERLDDFLSGGADGARGSGLPNLLTNDGIDSGSELADFIRFFLSNDSLLGLAKPIADR